MMEYKVGFEVEEFKRFLEEHRLSRSWIRDLMRYARIYYKLVFAAPQAIRAELSMLSPSKRNKVLSALSWVARFLEEKCGCISYEEWLVKLRKAKVKWHLEFPRPSIVEELDKILDMISKAAQLLEPLRYRVFIGFLLATGLRPIEAAAAWRRYWRIRCTFKDMIYLDLVEAGLYRRTKRAIVALVHPLIDTHMPRTPTIGLNNVRKKWNRICETLYGKRIELYTFRKLHATILLRAGLQEWQVDLLQGRLGEHLVRRVYTLHDLLQMWKIYVKALEKPLAGILDH